MYTEHDFYDAIPMPCLMFLRHPRSCLLCFFDNPFSIHRIFNLLVDIEVSYTTGY